MFTTTKIGDVSPFPPLPGQPYPPCRKHPRWKELCRLHDEWILKYWPFSTEKNRAFLPFMNLAAIAWLVPAADFDRMVWSNRLMGLYFLVDDYLDTENMSADRIPGFKKTATGTGALHPEDKAELCHDIAFRAIKASSHPRTFDQLTKCTHEWWNSQSFHEPFRNVDQYLAFRRIDVGMYFSHAIYRWALDINLTDEQVNHPLIREAEGVICDQVALVNDYFSYAAEASNTDGKNVIRILQELEGLSYAQAMKVAEKKAREKEQEFIQAGRAVLNHAELGKDAEVRRWIACLPYVMGGNAAWSQETARYKIGIVPGGVSFPHLTFEVEATPEAEVVDDTEESRLRDLVFEDEPVLGKPNFGAEIESGSVKTLTTSKILISSLLDLPQEHRPKNVGIVAIEIDLSKLGGPGSVNPVAPFGAVTTLLSRYAIEPTRIGHLYVTLTTPDKFKNVTSLVDMFKSKGNADIELSISVSSSCASVTALLNAVNWIESSFWDGRYALVFVGNNESNVAVLIGADAPVVLEPYRGVSLTEPGDSTAATVSSSLQEAFLVYQRKRAACLARSGLSISSEIDATGTFFAFDYMIYDGTCEDFLRNAHIDIYEMCRRDLQGQNVCSTSSEDFDSRVGPALSILQHTDQTSPLMRLAFLIGTVPAYDMFEKRIALLTYMGGTGSSSCLSLRVKGDTKCIREAINSSRSSSAPIPQSKISVLSLILDFFPKYLGYLRPSQIL